MNDPTTSFVERFCLANAGCTEDQSRFDKALVAEIGRISSLEDFMRSTSFNAAAKQALLTSYSNAQSANTPRNFCTQGTTRSITTNGQDFFGHPFDSIPMCLLSFVVYPDKRLEPQHALHKFEAQTSTLY
tara:strand:- start:14055 stop:14444 length:390 start_codon:yes stop_codon:yes gene_type:complete